MSTSIPWTSPTKRAGTVEGMNGPVTHIDPETGFPIKESQPPTEKMKIEFYLNNNAVLTGEIRRLKIKYSHGGYESLTKEEKSYILTSRGFKADAIGGV